MNGVQDQNIPWTDQESAFCPVNQEHVHQNCYKKELWNDIQQSAAKKIIESMKAMKWNGDYKI